MLICLLPYEGILFEVNRFFQGEDRYIILDDAQSTTNEKWVVILVVDNFGFDCSSLIFVRNIMLSLYQIMKININEI